MNKILFVCFGNVGRSQMAEAFYNKYTKSNNAFSAGTDPTTPQRYSELPKDILQTMKDDGVDISGQKVKLITREMVDSADKIFILCKKDQCPDFLLNSDKITYWNIEDPFEMSIDNTRKIRDEIKNKVLAII